ncbi:RNA-binding protein with KH domain [Thermovibrio guaymasensis]|uniref:RNA-binding protein KhpA n=1 Tax=Thermovibrio guaymasensis TaxID=240167 RepID=A0A420W6C1_9BACT|nr:KH domain-containing protein [Thermovibrio guaymasensis]RKQ61648.1 RNA-binding protein with KH domain [Thermovibrio guaymasensis]
MSALKEMVECVAKRLVDNPDQVQVTETEGERTIVIELKVAPADLGKVIGRQGRTAKALRTLLSAAATKMGKRAVLEIIE